MKEIERRTENIARVMAKEAGRPLSRFTVEMFLGDAYNLVYFGDKTELARIEAKVEWYKAKSRRELKKRGSTS